MNNNWTADDGKTVRALFSTKQSIILTTVGTVEREEAIHMLTHIYLSVCVSLSLKTLFLNRVQR